METIYFKKIITLLIVFILIVLSFFLVKPILFSLITAIILAFIFTPIYTRLLKIIPSKNLSAFLICIFLILLIIVPLWFLTPIVIDQSFKIFLASQQIDFIKPLKTFFPSFFASEQFSQEVGSILHSSVTRLANSVTNILSNLILNFPTLFLQSIIMFFTFFFVLRDQEELLDYIKSLSPFPKEIDKKIYESTRDTTFSIIYGQVLTGIAEGIALGIGFFIFKVPNALFFTLIAIAIGILPIVSTSILWIPVAIYLISIGNNSSALGIIFFGVISSSIDDFIRPLVIAKRIHMHSVLVLVGMVGGIFLFGILGFILDPLVLAYLLILLETYRTGRTPEILIQPAEEK